MKNWSCFAALLTCRVDNQPPPTFPLLINPTSRANVFLLSPTKAVAALHSIPPTHEKHVRIAGANAHVSHKCEEADLALLELDRAIFEFLSVSFASPRKRSVCYALSPALNRLRLTFLGVQSVILVYYASRLPVFVFSASCPVFPGCSGSPVTNAQNELVGVLIQARENIVHVVPSRFILLLQQCQKHLYVGYIPALYVHSGPDASRKVTVDRDTDELRKGDVVLQIGRRKVHRGSVSWEGLRAPVQAAVVDLFGTKAQVRVMRKGRIKTVHVRVRSASQGCAAVGRHTGVCVLAGPFKMVTLSMQMLESFGARWQTRANPGLVRLAIDEGDGNDVVVVVRAPESRRSLLFQRVQHLDGAPVKTAEQLASGGLLTFESGEILQLPSMSVRRCDNPL
ncbi:Peptidase S1 PA clan [Gracilaria domingensis]|nr:Peptidase S1 PA clan [Gracilaria domingensis]